MLLKRVQGYEYIPKLVEEVHIKSNFHYIRNITGIKNNIRGDHGL